jgi:hypothetical protein
MLGSPHNGGVGDLILYFSALALGLALILLLLAVLSESLIKIARAIGSALIALPSVMIPFCEGMEDAVCTLAHHAMGVVGTGWARIMAILDLVLFIALAGSEFFYLVARLGPLFGVHAIKGSGQLLSVLLGITFTAATATIALRWREQREKALADPSNVANAKALRWIAVAGVLVVVSASLLGIWTAEIVFAGVNDLTMGAAFLISLAVLVVVAVGLTIHGAIRGAVVLVGVLLYLVWPLLYLLATICYFWTEIIAHITAILEQILVLPRELVRQGYNITKRGQANPWFPDVDGPLINAHVVRPVLKRQLPPVVPLAPVVAPGVPLAVPNGTTAPAPGITATPPTP